jgi:hypothetical protein
MSKIYETSPGADAREAFDPRETLREALKLAAETETRLDRMLRASAWAYGCTPKRPGERPS